MRTGVRTRHGCGSRSIGRAPPHTHRYGHSHPDQLPVLQLKHQAWPRGSDGISAGLRYFSLPDKSRAAFEGVSYSCQMDLAEKLH